MGLRKTPEDRQRAVDGDLRAAGQRIAAYIRDQILSGDIKPGDPIPSISELCGQFGASITAVQNAMRTLKDEGLVATQKGKSTIAREARMRVMRPADFFAPAEPGQPYRWIAEAQRQGMTATSELLDVEEVAPPASVARALGIEPGMTAMLRRQLLKLDGEPAELVENYYPIEIARGTPIAEGKKVKGGVPTLLAEMGFPFRRSVDRVSARTPTPEQGVHLKMPVGELPVLRTFRTVYSDDDRVIEVTVMAKAGHLYELEYEIAGDQLPQ
ncbi:GntR family transcriptional regulator [Kitasatospora sp. NPDC047058]|uniref:GntR family transcriptional regulator n=1 Tax=Kitasatospora sp. NPDC047058 TaxID=3155620 RepID=UPI00340B1960